jgi:intraflagellar transport protein 172
VTNHQIKGDVYEIERSSGRTEVIVNEGFREASYLLDEALIEFGTAIEDRDYAKAMEVGAALVLSLSLLLLLQSMLCCV